jgi:hypothetical protein
VMTPQADGTLVPDPTQAAPSAYPLTMVEYAFAPADGLGARCATLVGWLEHVTGAGQQHLPEGLVSLAAAGLDDEAGQAVAQLAAAPTCGEAAGPGGPSGGAGPPSTPSSGAPPGTGGGFGDAGSGLGGPDGGFDGGSADATSLVGGPSAAPDSSREAAADEAAEAAAEAEIEMPPFGIVGFERFGPPTAVLLVVFATSVAALVSSGRPLPAAVTAVPTLARRAGRAAQRTLRLPLRARS